MYADFVVIQKILCIVYLSQYGEYHNALFENTRRLLCYQFIITLECLK